MQFSKIVFALICFSLSLPALALETKSGKKLNLAPREEVAKKPGYRKNSVPETLRNTKIQKQDVEPQSRLKVTAGCTDGSGKFLNANDPGYQKCADEASAQGRPSDAGHGQSKSATTLNISN